jgi:UDP-N-acetylmuramate--alanine ligase
MFGINKELKIHFIGIGGIGMSGIAEILINLGYHVSGSDISTNPNTEKLNSKGAEIFLGHKSENIKDVQLIVYSSAIDEANPEIMQARVDGLPIIKRAEMLAELMRLKFGVAIAGSHGKTTTTSFLSTILKELDYKPTCIVGGIVKNLGGHALKGDSEYLIAEADESDGSFLFLNPIMSIITNIDNDHLDYYKTVENIESAFEEFANKVPFYGCVAININDEKSRKLRDKLRRPYVTYGVYDEESECDSEKPEYYASNIVFTEDGTSFDVCHKDEKVKANITLAGNHNVLNALSAIVIAHKLESNLTCICKAIESFEGVGRRFELLYKNDKMVVVDDYGHHPTEVLATLQTAKDKYPNKKIVAVFEPHRFSRTKEFWGEFRDSFSSVEKVYIAPIYAASEKGIDGITSENLVRDIKKSYGNAELLPDWGQLPNIFEKYRDENIIILSMGAGSISKLTRQKLEEWTLAN